ncbi:hypothetical protein FA10DRAFT_265138 [Acaromyces ingoldii]|uniref:Uncharacterized protein n=1 Tax=Acaromyces ingoldii TaxID=215250 RepID=A0A316YPR1_9BASI|nr:hypothetical protein FA10DRAFT_265138 [Acaromyces ingoldii]PWN91269.1 hypothetical protein FA10DRAFT_265138 [Acaromyces ingoldii]
MSSAPAEARKLFRSISREIRRGSVHSRPNQARRAEPLPTYLRTIFSSGSGADADDAAHARKRMENLHLMLQHGRIHAELLSRYNPVYGKSNAEHIKATANRVGLDVPQEYSPIQSAAAALHAANSNIASADGGKKQ